MPEVLTDSKITFYHGFGYLVLEHHLPAEIVNTVRTEIIRFEDEARELTVSNERLELEQGHTPSNRGFDESGFHT